MAAPVDETTAQNLGADIAPLVRIRALAPSLPASDRRAAEVILEWNEAVLPRSVTEVARAASVAESTVIRACKRLGFRGFQDLKVAIAMDRRPRSHLVGDDISADDSASDVLAKVFATSSATLAEAATSVNIQSLERMIDAIAHADRLLVAGMGPSSPIAQDAAYRFRSLGIRVEAPVDSISQHLAAGLLSAGDCCLVISHSGATPVMIKAAEAAREVGAVTAAITSFAQSPLVNAVDYALVAGGSQLSFRAEAMASRLAHLCVIDTLYVGVAMRDEARAEHALATHHKVLSDHQI